MITEEQANLILGLLGKLPPISTIGNIDVHDYASLKESIIFDEIKQEEKKLVDALMKTGGLATFEDEFKAFCQQRAIQNQHTALSFSALPTGDTNRLYWEIAKILFNPKTNQEMLEILLPNIQNVVTIEFLCGTGLNKRELQQAMREAKPTLEKKPISKVNLGVLSDNFSHLVMAGNTLIDITDIADLPLPMQTHIYTALKQTYPDLTEKLYSHNHVLSALEHDIQLLETQGLTPREAFERLIKDLTLGGSRLTGNEFAGIGAQVAYETFFDYWKTLPNAMQDSLNALSSYPKTLGQILNDLKTGHCVETAARDLTGILSQHKDTPLLHQLPHLKKEDIQAIEKRYQALLKAGIPSEGLDLTFSFPAQLLGKSVRTISLQSSDELITLLLNFSANLYPDLFEHLNFTAIDNPLKELSNIMSSGLLNQAQVAGVKLAISKNMHRFGLKHALKLSIEQNDVNMLLAALALYPDDTSRIAAVENSRLLHLAALHPESRDAILAIYPDPKSKVDAINQTDGNGNTLLHLTALHPESRDAILALYPDNESKMAAANQKDWAGRTLLHLTALHPESRDAILALYPDPKSKVDAINQTDRYGSTLLHLTVLHPESRDAILAIYPDNESKMAAVNQKNGDGNTLLHLAASNPEAMRSILALYPDDLSRLTALFNKNKENKNILDLTESRPESRQAILDSFSALLFEQLTNLIQSAKNIRSLNHAFPLTENFHYILSLLPDAKRAELLTLLINESNHLIESSHSSEFIAISQLLPPEAYLALTKAVISQLPKICSSIYDMTQIMDATKSENHPAMMAALASELPRLYRNEAPSKKEKSNHYSSYSNYSSTPEERFSQSLRHFYGEESSIFCAALINELPDLIDSAHIFNSVLYRLKPEQRTELFVKMESQLPGLMTTTNDVRSILSHLTPEQRVRASTPLVDALRQGIQSADKLNAFPELIQLSYSSSSGSHSKTTESFHAIMKELTVVQQSMIVTALFESFSRLINSADDFATALMYLNTDQQTTLVEQYIKQLPKLIRSTDDLVKIMAQLSSEQITGLLKTLSPEFPRLFKTSKELMKTLIGLNKERKDIVLNALTNDFPRLFQNATNFEGFAHHLSIEQCLMVFKALVPELPRLNQEDNFLCVTMYHLSKEQQSSVCTMLSDQLFDLVKSTKDLASILPTFPPEQCSELMTKVIQKRPNILYKVKNSYEYESRFSYIFSKALTKEQCEAVLTALTGEYFRMIQAEGDFDWDSLWNYGENKTLVFTALMGELCRLIQSAKNFSDFPDVIKCHKYNDIYSKLLNKLYKVSESLCHQVETTLYDALPHLVHSAKDLTLAFAYTHERPQLIATLFNRLPQLVDSVEEFNDLMEYATPEQGEEIVTMLTSEFPRLIHRIQDIESVRKHLTPEQCLLLTEVIINEYPRIIKESAKEKGDMWAIYYYPTIMSYLTPEQKLTTTTALFDDFPDMIRSMSHLATVFASLTSEAQKTKLVSTLRSRFPELIQSMSDFDTALGFLSTEQRIPLISELSTQFPKIVGENNYYFIRVLRSLSPIEQRMLVSATFEVLDKVLQRDSQLIEIVKILTQAPEAVENAKQAMALTEKFGSLIKTASAYHAAFAGCFSKEQHSHLIMTLSTKSPNFIKTTDDLSIALSYLTPEALVHVARQCPLTFSSRCLKHEALTSDQYLAMAIALNDQLPGRLARMFSKFSLEICQTAFKKLRPNTLLASELNELLWHITPAQGAAIVLDSLRHLKPDFHVSDIFLNLDAAKRAAIYQAIESSIPTLIRTQEEWDAFKESVAELTQETRLTLDTKFAMKSIVDFGDYPSLKQALDDYCQAPTPEKIKLFLTLTREVKHPPKEGFFNEKQHKDLDRVFLEKLPVEIRGQLGPESKSAP